MFESLVWRVAKRLPHVEDARRLKVKELRRDESDHQGNMFIARTETVILQNVAKLIAVRYFTTTTTTYCN